MIYYKYQDEFSPIEGAVTYVETDEGLAYRQITVNSDKFVMSNINYPGWGLMLAEGEINPSNDEAEVITKKEFDDVWNSHLVSHQIEWNDTKLKYPKGIEVAGYIQIFYPQGVIIN